MRTRPNGSGGILIGVHPVPVMEFDVLDTEPLRTRGDDSTGTGGSEGTANRIVGTFADNDTSVDKALFVFLGFPSHFELNSSKEVICDLEVLELNGSGSASNSSISSVSISCEVFIDSRYSWVIGFVVRRAWLSEREVIVEYSQSISATGVSNVALELSELRLDRADVFAETGSHSVILHVEPEAVSV